MISHSALQPRRIGHGQANERTSALSLPPIGILSRGPVVTLLAGKRLSALGSATRWMMRVEGGCGV